MTTAVSGEIGKRQMLLSMLVPVSRPLSSAQLHALLAQMVWANTNLFRERNCQWGPSSVLPISGGNTFLAVRGGPRPSG